MEKVKFWKNTSSEFDKIASKDANTIYYLTDTGKIYLGEKMYGGTDMPFTIVSKDDKRFSSFDTLFLKGENDGKFKLSVDPVVYCLADDMEFAFSAFIYLEDFLKFMYQDQSADLGNLVYKSTQCTLPKGSFIYITENMLEIYCTYTDVKTYGPGGVSSESFTHCEVYIIGTYPVALDDNEHVCGVIEFDSMMRDMEDGVLTYPLEYAMMNIEGYKEGDTLVVTNNDDDPSSPGSWSGPKFKIGSAGVQATQITDVNYTNYQTMDQWSALNDGMYLVNTDKLSINVVGKNKVYSAGSAGFCGLLGIEENYNKSLSIPKGNYISVYTTEAGGSSYYKYKMMVIYQIEANPDAEENNRPSAGQAVVITLGSTYMSNPFSKDVKVYDFNESSMLQSTLNNYISLIFTPLSSPDTVPKDGQLAQWEGDADHGFKLKGVDAPKGSSINVIEEKDKDKYNTLDKLCHLEDGLYLCKDTYKANQDYIVDITFKGINLADAATASFTGTPPTPDTNGSTKCKNGAIISVVTQEGSTKNKIVRITHGLSANISTQGEGFEDIYIVAKPDDSSTASTLVYGVTGTNVRYYRPFSVNTIYGSLFPFAAMSNSLMGGSVNGKKMAVWDRPEGADMPTLGFADIPTSDKIQENESTSVVLNNHTEYRCKVMASLNLSLPETIPDDYNSRIVFESGETATTLSYTADSIKFTGDDCDSSNAFIPAASTSYEVDIKYLGLDSSGNKRIIARVGAF